MAERMGFWQSLLDKFKGKKPSSHTIKEKEMIAIDDAIQSKFKLLKDNFINIRNIFNEEGINSQTLKQVFDQLDQYNNNLKEMSDAGSSLMEFGEKHDLSSYSAFNQLFLIKLAQTIPEQSLIRLYQNTIVKFLKETLNENMKTIHSLANALSYARENNNVGKYILKLKEIKPLVTDFNDHLNDLKNHVFMLYQGVLGRIHERSKGNLGETFEEMGKTLKEGPSTIPEVILPSQKERFRSQLKDVGEYTQGLPSTNRSKTLALSAHNKTNNLIACASMMHRKYVID